MPSNRSPRPRALRRLLSIACLAAMACSAQLISLPEAYAQARFDFASTPGRLSKAVRPSHYLLQFDLDPAQPRFGGVTSIDLQITEPQPALVVHARNLQAQRVELRDASGRIQRLKVTPDEATQTWRLTPLGVQRLAAGDYRLVIRYTGQVNRSGEGLYVTSEKRDPMLATQLQAVHARTLFPGFDEPAFRARFEVEIRAPEALEVVSNMPLASVQTVQTVQAGRGAPARASSPQRVHRFEPTPPMPSYLVALAVGRFDRLEDRLGELPLRILTAPGKREQAHYAMRASKDVLGYFGDYFGQPFSLPKLDQLAVPSVRGGAMEDWGLISYAENALLVDPARSGPQDLRRTYNIVAHEIAHQWFGNLVTAASWNEIWLNEAFATWMASKASARFNPDWRLDLAARDGLESVFARDAGSATRAMRGGLVREDRVFEVFDSVTYNKGGAVLSMIEAWLGPEVFQRGLAAYMAERKLSNATAGDLWHHLSAASGFDVSTVARSWTDQSGYPRVQVDARCVDGRTQVDLRQQRDVIGTPKATTAQPVWAIPVRVARGDRQETLMLDAPEGRFDLQGCPDAPLVVNAGGLAFYRVQYSPELQRALLRRFESLSPADQITLSSDTLALAQAGRVPLAQWFELLAAMPAAGDASRASLLSQAARALDSLDDALVGSPTQPALRAAARAVLAPALDRLGWAPKPGEAPPDTLLRSRLIRQLARFDDEAVLARAGELFDRDRQGGPRLDASLRDAITFAAGRGADRARFDRLRDELLVSPSAAERYSLATALAAGRDAGRATELMAMSLRGQLSSELAASLPGLVAEHSGFGEQAYRFSVEHWAQLAELSGSGVFGRRQGLLPAAAKGFSQRSEAERLRADQQRLAGDAGAMRAGEMAEAIEQRAALREREASALAEWLPRWKPRAAAPAGGPDAF